MNYFYRLKYFGWIEVQNIVAFKEARYDAISNPEAEYTYINAKNLKIDKDNPTYGYGNFGIRVSFRLYFHFIINLLMI